VELVGVGDIKKYFDYAFIGLQFSFLFSGLERDAGSFEVIT
jgi:hypothetical protein